MRPKDAEWGIRLSRQSEMTIGTNVMVGGWMDGWMYVWMDEWVNGWVDGWMVGFFLNI